MVGVAGRSRGCVTCRLRRVKCDEGHPTCNRCTKAGRVCGGYVQNNFIEGLPSRSVPMKARGGGGGGGVGSGGANGSSGVGGSGGSSTATATSRRKKKDAELPSTRERLLVVRSTPASGASASASAAASASASASASPPFTFLSAAPSPAPSSAFSFSSSSDGGQTGSSTRSVTPAHSAKSSSPPRSTSDLDLDLDLDLDVDLDFGIDDDTEDWDVEAEFGMDEETRALLPQLEAMQATAVVAPALDLRPFQDSIILAYAVDNMLKGLRHTAGFRFTDFVPRGGALSRDALLTSATAYFGHRHGQADIIQLGRQRYGNVLKELNAALADPEASRSTMVIFSVMTLTLFEFVNHSGMFGWVHHALGIERLFAHRGPHASMSGEGHIALDQLRMTVVFACLAAEKECLLATPEWCTIPWSLDPAAKSLDQYLMDILGQFGPWMGAMTRFWQSVDPTEADAAAVFEANKGMKTSLKQLDLWWQLFYSRHRDDCWVTPMDVSGLQADEVPRLWDTIYRFPSLAPAKDFINYHATRSMTLGYIRGVDAMAPDADASALAHLAAGSRTAAVEACRAVNFHLEPDKDGAGSLFLIFPLRIAWRTIGGSDTPEGRWMKYTANTIGRGHRGGWGSMGSMLFDEYDIRNGLSQVRTG